VNEVDRISLGLESGPADGFSYATQNISGYLAIGGTVVWNAVTAAGGAVSPVAAAAAAGTDLVLLGQAASWNGVFNELCHGIARRPRPFVYSNPEWRGADPSHYTSFYSGHTSFAAVAGLSLVLMLLARGAPAWLIALSALSWQGLTLATGYFRVMAGRHFLTDVVAAAWIGSAFALIVFLAHKLQRRAP
jgi:undecaprenyl-diphosphatase